MSRYFSDYPVWVGSKSVIIGLDQKNVLFVKGEVQWEGQLCVEPGARNSQAENGKLSVSTSYVGVTDEPPEEIAIIPAEPPKYSDVNYRRLYLTQEALDSLRPRSNSWPSHIELQLDLSGDASSPDR
jgi:hypothetical protein